MPGSNRHGYTLGYVPSLDGLRAVAIVAVVLYHACASSGRPGWFRGGFIGVSVFFTLSGFLIASVLLREFDERGHIAAGRFWSRRITRLIPAQMTTIVTVMVLVWFGLVDAHRSDVVAAAWSVTNWHIIASGPERILQTAVGPLGPTWSLAIEEQFYLILIVVVMALVAKTARPGRWLGGVAAVAIVASVVAQLLVAGWNARAEFGLDTRAAELAMGVGLAVLARAGVVPIVARRTDTEPDALVFNTYDLAAGIGLAAIGVAALSVTYDPPWLLRGGYTLVAVVSAVTIVGLIGGGRVARALASRPLVQIGQLSYSWYLVHWPVMLVLSPARTGLNGLSLVVVKVAASAVAGVVLSTGIENPIRRRPTVRPPIAVATWVASAVAITAVAWLTLVA